MGHVTHHNGLAFKDFNTLIFFSSTWDYAWNSPMQVMWRNQRQWIM